MSNLHYGRAVVAFLLLAVVILGWNHIAGDNSFLYYIVVLPTCILVGWWAGHWTYKHD